MYVKLWCWNEPIDWAVLITIGNCWNNSKIKYKIVERCHIDSPTTQIHGRSLFWLGTSTTINSGVSNYM